MQIFNLPEVIDRYYKTVVEQIPFSYCYLPGTAQMNLENGCIFN